MDAWRDVKAVLRITYCNKKERVGEREGERKRCREKESKIKKFNHSRDLGLSKIN
jgi:hypothetical protein